MALELKLNNVIMANHELTKSFHHPALPTSYTIDRKGWMANRYVDLKVEDIKKIDEYLVLQTAL